MRLGSNPSILASRIVTLDYASSSTLSAPLSLIFFYRRVRCIWFLARALTTRTHHPWCSATYRTFYASCLRGQYNHLHMQPESPIRCRLGMPSYQRYLSPIRHFYLFFCSASCDFFFNTCFLGFFTFFLPLLPTFLPPYLIPSQRLSTHPSICTFASRRIIVFSPRISRYQVFQNFSGMPDAVDYT